MKKILEVTTILSVLAMLPLSLSADSTDSTVYEGKRATVTKSNDEIVVTGNNGGTVSAGDNYGISVSGPNGTKASRTGTGHAKVVGNNEGGIVIDRTGEDNSVTIYSPKGGSIEKVVGENGSVTATKANDDTFTKSKKDAPKKSQLSSKKTNR